MASYIETENYGSYASIEALWSAHPEGGVEGAYCTINDVKYHWNKYDRMWIVNPNYGPTPSRRVTTFDGNVNFQNDVTIAGTLRAKHVKQPGVGLFATEAALEAAYPEPEVGMWAVIGDESPFTLYRCSTEGTWTEVTDGNGVDITVDIDAIETAMDELEYSQKLSDARNVWDVDDTYSYDLDNLLPFRKIEVYGDIDTFTAMSILDSTVSYSNAAQSSSNLALFSVTKGGNSSQFAITKGDVSSSLGVQRIVKEYNRGNLVFVFTIDFDMLEDYYGVTRASVGMWCKKETHNPFIERREHLNGGYVLPTVTDTYDIGTKLFVRLSDGANTLTNLNTRSSLTNYNAERVPLVVNSYGDSIVEVLKTGEDDWVLLGRMVQMDNGKAVSDREGTIGAYTGGISGSKNVGINSSSEAFTVVLRFRTPKGVPTASAYLFSNTVLDIFIRGSYNTLYVQSGSTNTLVMYPNALAPDTDYTVVLTWDDGDVSLTVNGDTVTATGTTLASGSEYYPYIGSNRNGTTPTNKFTGLIEAVKVYSSVITDADELASGYSTHADLSLNLQPASVREDCWLDLSSEMSVFTPRVQDGRISVVLETLEVEEEEIEIVTALDKVNLFNPANVVEGYILDSSSGKIVEWSTASHGEYGAVAKIPATKGKYYCIIDPYWVYVPSRVGVMLGTSDFGNPSAHNIVYTGRRYAIAKAEYVSDVSIDTLTFVLYRQSSDVPYPIKTPLVEVYEMDSISEAVSYIKSRFGETTELDSSVNLDRAILASDHVGTLTSLFADKTMLVLGDSITASHGWTDYVANRLKWHGIHNVAIGGANIMGPHTPSDNSIKRHLIYQVKECANWLADVCYAEGNLANGVYVKKVDYVFISMGYNDAANGFTPGVVSDVVSTSWSSLAPSSDSTAFSSIAAAIKYCLFYLKTTPVTGSLSVNGVTKNVALDCREARFIWQTPIATSTLFGNDSAETTDARLLAVENVITDMCEHYSVQVVNGRKMCGFTREEEGLVTGGKYLKDGVHPNSKGMIKIGEMNLGAILSN